MRFMVPIIFLMVLNLLTGSVFCEQFQKKEFSSTVTDGYIRAGISTNDFKRLEYEKVSLFSKGILKVRDKFSAQDIAEVDPDEILEIKIDKKVFMLEKNGKKIAENIKGPISVEPENNQNIEILELKRKGKQAAYRGIFEIIRAPGKEGLLSVVNVILLEDYLKGVVPNELPVHFGLEALKAQTVAARNYAIRPRVRFYSQFDVCDSVASQVYFGANTEEPLSNQAVDATKGLVGLYNGEVILALYSSTAGGYTESYENAFAEPCGGVFPAQPLPYLKGRPDIKGTLILNTDEAAKEFYLNKPDSFDMESRYYRWSRIWTAEELREVLNKSIPENNKDKLISPDLKEGEDIGKIKSVEVLSRGVSGKAIEIKVTTDKGEWSIKKELVIRRVFKNHGKALPSANLVFINYPDSSGNLLKLEVFGGGFGHGVGMSQYGASYMAKHCFNFEEILQHYYTGISIGTWPVFLDSENVKSPVRQIFVAPNKKAELVIENKYKIEKFEFIVNSNKIFVGKDELLKDKIRISIDNYLINGENEIVFPPLFEEPGKSVKVWVEVVKGNEF